MSDSTPASEVCPEVPANGYALPLSEYYNNNVTMSTIYRLSPTYSTTFAIERVYQWSYRWNQNTDLTDLIRRRQPDSEINFSTSTSHDDQRSSYLIGVLWISLALLLIALLWFLLLACCKCWGPKYVGFFSARRLRPSPPDEPTEALEKRRHQQKFSKKDPISSSNNNGGGGGGGGLPLQYNGVATTTVTTGAWGYDEMGLPQTKKKKKKKAQRLVRGTIQAPKKLVQSTIQAPKNIYRLSKKHKRKLQQTFGSKRFARINSAGDIELGDFLQEEEQQQQQQPGSTILGSSTTTDESPPLPSNVLMTQKDERDLADYDTALLHYYQVCDARNTRIRRIRGTVAVCAMAVVTTVVLFIIMGAVPLVTISADTTHTAIGQLHQQTIQLQNAITQIQTKQQITATVTQQFWGEVNELCPKVTAEFCTNLVAPPTTNNKNNQDEEEQQQLQPVCDFSSFPQLQQELEQIFHYLDETFNLVLPEQTLQDMQVDLQTLYYLLDRADVYYPTTVTWTIWVAVGCNVTLALLALWICVSVVRLYFGRPVPGKWVRSFVLVPLWLLLVVLGWIFTCVCVVSVIGMADACIDSPDAILLAILERNQDKFIGGGSDSVIYDFLHYYLQGCPVETAPQQLDQRIVILTDLIVPAVQNIETAMERVGWTTLQDLCGVKDLSIFSSQLAGLQSQLCELANSVLDARMLLNCPDWVQWYQLAAYYGVCYSSSTALVWIVSTQLVNMVFCMIIVTLRVSYYELPEVADEGRNNKCVSHWCCCVELMEEEEEDEEDDDDKDEYSDNEYHSTHDSGNSEDFEKQVEGGKEDKDEDERNGSRNVGKVEAVIEQSERSVSTAASQQRDNGHETR